MGCSHPRMPMVCCNAMVWTDETEEGGRLKVLVIHSYPVACTTVVVTGASDTVRAADGDSRREALHGAQMVREAVAGEAAHADAQEQPDR
jgi:voltage-gated potassium channel Kch